MSPVGLAPRSPRKPSFLSRNPSAPVTTIPIPMTPLQTTSRTAMRLSPRSKPVRPSPIAPSPRRQISRTLPIRRWTRVKTAIQTVLTKATTCGYSPPTTLHLFQMMMPDGPMTQATMLRPACSQSERSDQSFTPSTAIFRRMPVPIQRIPLQPVRRNSIRRTRFRTPQRRTFPIPKLRCPSVSSRQIQPL